MTLPPGWTLRRYADLGTWHGGGTPSKSNTKYWCGGSVPWLSPKDMGAEVLQNTQDHITPEAVTESAVRLVPPGSVSIVVRSGILERTLPVALVPFETTLNQDMKAVSPAADVDPRWIAWGLRAAEGQLLRDCRKTGTTVASMEMSRWYAQTMPVPPLDEQRHIVEILEGHLSRLDAAAGDIESARNKLAVLLPAGVAAAFRASGGTTRPLGEVAQWGSGGTPKAGVADYYVGGTIPWLNSGDLADGPISTVPRHITDLGLAKSSAKWVPPGSVLVAMYGATIGRLGLATTPLTTNQAIAYATLGPDVIAEYLFWFLRSQRPQLIAAGKGGAQPNISQAVLKAWELPVPDLSTQEVVVRQAEFIAAGVNRLSDQLQRLRRRDWSFRKALFAAAFSGRLTRITSFDEIEEMADV